MFSGQGYVCVCGGGGGAAEWNYAKLNKKKKEQNITRLVCILLDGGYKGNVLNGSQ